MAANRPSLQDAARRWLNSTRKSDDPSTGALRTALTDFVEGRYRGAAEDLKRVHALRRSYFGDDRIVAELSDASPGPWDRSTLDQAAAGSATPDQGRLLFHLTRAFQPRHALELGTNIGISAAYLAIGLRHQGRGSLTTVEASGKRLEVARSNFLELALQGIETIEGYFDDVLPDLLSRGERFTLAFVDGNHQLDATVKYYEMLDRHMGQGGLVILDDIRWSEGMTEAWETISSSNTAAAVVDLGRTGLVVTA